MYRTISFFRLRRPEKSGKHFSLECRRGGTAKYVAAAPDFWSERLPLFFVLFGVYAINRF